jgi:16S rRNA (cytosine967-C5)-methyltransferase
LNVNPAISAGAASRAAAARVLVAVRFEGQSLRAAMAPPISTLVDMRDRALAESSVFAACRGLFRYEALLGLLLQRPLARSDAAVHALLLVGLTQLDSLGMAPHGVVDACVGAARLLQRPRHAALVNALLRRYLRERAALDAQLATDETALLNHPAWLISALREAWGSDAEAVMAAGNCQPPLWLRVNRRRTDRASYVDMLTRAGIESMADATLPMALQLPAAPPARSLPGWDAGLVSVQDSSAQRAVEALAAEPGVRVLDACAAPGGKTAALLEAVDAVEVLALDADRERLARIGPALQRLGLNATLALGDACAPEGWWDGRPFDRILIDAPCSATGILRRQPDIRWHRRSADIAPLCALQARMLDALWPLLASGGRLVYATCSMLPDENARQIDAFLERHPDAVSLALPAAFGRVAGGGRQRLAGEDGGDGFFVAALQRG